jgi:hypothetical protein
MEATLADRVPQLVKTGRAAQILGDSPRQVRQLARRGVLDPIRLTEGGHLHFRLDEIVALVTRGAKEDEHDV